MVHGTCSRSPFTVAGQDNLIQKVVIFFRSNLKLFSLQTVYLTVYKRKDDKRSIYSYPNKRSKCGNIRYKQASEILTFSRFIRTGNNFHLALKRRLANSSPSSRGPSRSNSLCLQGSKGHMREKLFPLTLSAAHEKKSKAPRSELMDELNRSATALEFHD